MRTLKSAVRAGKLNQCCKEVGGFAVARLGGIPAYDYFPFGQPPNVHGNPVEATIVERWHYTGGKWRRTTPEH